MLRRTGLDPDDPGPVFGMVGRLDPQKGFDLLVDAAPRLLAAGIRLIVQGSGDPVIAAGLRALATAYPYQVGFVPRFDRAMARRIYAGTDAFLMPSRFEPCGQGQMIGLRYGTPPIVHATGGLRDTVIDEHDRPGEGTGYAFRYPTADGLAWACEQAAASLTAREPGPRGWDALVARGMAVDFDWVTGSAPQYLDVYRRAVQIRRSAMSARGARRLPSPGRSGVVPSGSGTIPT